MKQSKKFLVLEDMEDVARNNCTFLQMIDPKARCEIVPSPQAAKDSLARRMPDLLVIDLMLDEKGAIDQKTSGVAFLQYVLCHHPHLNVLVYSTNPELAKQLSLNIKKHKGGFSIVDKMELRTAFIAGANTALLGEKRTPDSFVDAAY